MDDETKNYRLNMAVKYFIHFGLVVLNIFKQSFETIIDLRNDDLKKDLVVPPSTGKAFNWISTLYVSINLSSTGQRRRCCAESCSRDREHVWVREVEFDRNFTKKS